MIHFSKLNKMVQDLGSFNAIFLPVLFQDSQILPGYSLLQFFPMAYVQNLYISQNDLSQAISRKIR